MLYSLLSRGAQTLASCARGFAFVFATKWRFFCWGWNYPSAYFPLSSRRSSERLIAAVKAWGQPNLFLKMLRSSYKCYGKSSLLAKICYQRPSINLFEKRLSTSQSSSLMKNVHRFFSSPSFFILKMGQAHLPMVMFYKQAVVNQTSQELRMLSRSLSVY